MIRTRFSGGPADGKHLNLQRSPIWLRVVIDPEGGVDALDQADDEPQQDEVIYVYLRRGEPTMGLACSRGAGGGCRSFGFAQYEWYHRTPPDSLLRDRESWIQWASSQLVPLPGMADGQ